MARGRDVTDTYADGNLEARIEVIKARIESWAVRHEIWRDCGFQSWAERYDDEPPVNPCVLILYCQEPLDDVLSGAADGNLQNEFVDLLEDTGFHFDLESHGVASFWVADDEPLKNGTPSLAP
jgi:restriction system protein